MNVLYVGKKRFFRIIMRDKIKQFINDNFIVGEEIFSVNNGKMLFDELRDFLRWELPNEECFDIDIVPINGGFSMLMIAWIENDEVQLYYTKVLDV